MHTAVACHPYRFRCFLPSWGGAANQGPTEKVLHSGSRTGLAECQSPQTVDPLGSSGLGHPLQEDPTRVHSPQQASTAHCCALIGLDESAHTSIMPSVKRGWRPTTPENSILAKTQL